MYIWKGKKRCHFPESSWTSWNLIIEFNTCRQQNSIHCRTSFLVLYPPIFLQAIPVKQEWKKDHSNLIDSIPSFNPDYLALGLALKESVGCLCICHQPNTEVKHTKGWVYFCLNNQIHERIISVLPPGIPAQIIFNCKRNFLNVYFKRRVLQLY